MNDIAPLPPIRPTSVPPERYRAGMSRLAAAVNIVTTDGPAGRAGFTASAVCSVSDRPPTLLVCLNEESSAAGAFRGNSGLCVNTTRPSHITLARLFGGGYPMPGRFAAARWTRGRSGAPILSDALTAFDCVIRDATTVGTHRVLFCEVLEVILPEIAAALVYYGRNFHEVQHEPDVFPVR